jgi:hypothetical protein
MRHTRFQLTLQLLPEWGVRLEGNLQGLCAALSELVPHADPNRVVENGSDRNLIWSAPTIGAVEEMVS